MKYCATCGRSKHKGLCDMVTLSDGSSVHVSRIVEGGDLHHRIGNDLEVTNRWIKPELGMKKERDERLAGPPD